VCVLVLVLKVPDGIGGAAWTTMLVCHCYFLGRLHWQTMPQARAQSSSLDIKVSTTHLQKPHRNCTGKSMSSKESYNPERDLKE
jgi:hypothetical protein